jgi:probable phosphoglycerate mutase
VIAAKAMARPTIYFIRHGETDWNATGRFQGSQDIPLNDNGRAQAVFAGGVLADLLARDAVAAASLSYVSSPLSRARVTIELVRGALGLPPDGYAIVPRLREIAYGRWEGLTVEQMQKSDPEVFAARGIDRWGVAPPGGESYASRAPLVAEWAHSLSADTVAVGHMGTGRALMVALAGIGSAEVVETKIEQGAVYVFGPNGMAKYS